MAKVRSKVDGGGPGKVPTRAVIAVEIMVDAAGYVSLGVDGGFENVVEGFEVAGGSSAVKGGKGIEKLEKFGILLLPAQRVVPRLACGVAFIVDAVVEVLFFFAII